MRLAVKSTYSARYKRFRSALAHARREAGLTQAQVAKAIGKPQSFISKAESGERRLDVIELLDILRVLAVRPDEFLQQTQR